MAASRAPERTDLYMTRVEVIDLRRNSLITYRTLPGIVLRLDPDLSATVYDLDEDQVPRLRVLQLGMTR